MTDETNDFEHGASLSPELRRRADAVSAVVDGVATDEDLALVRSDRKLQADVDTLTAVKETLRDVPPLDESLRDRLLGAAFAEFDARTRQGGDAPVPSAFVAPPPPARRTGATSRWLAVAAAVVAVVAAGGVALTVIDGSSDNDGAPTAGESGQVGDSGAVGGVPEDDPGATGTDAAETAGTADAEATSGSQPASEAVPDQTRASPGTTTAATGGGGPAEVTDEQSLADWVLGVRDEQFTASDAGSDRCGRVALGSTDYLGDKVYVIVEGTDAVARDADTCAEVLRVDKP